MLGAERQASRDDLDAAAASLRWVGIVIAAVVVALLGAAAYGLRRGVLDPIAALADQVRGVVSGDVHREVRGSGPREIVELGADVDAMRVHISDEVDVLQQVNRRLDDQARDLERSNRDLEQFAYVASHDLQEPLRKVSSFCQLPVQRRYGGQPRRAGRPVHRARRRRRPAHAAADQRPAGVLPRRAHHLRLRGRRPARDRAGRRGAAGRHA